MNYFLVYGRIFLVFFLTINFGLLIQCFQAGAIEQKIEGKSSIVQDGQAFHEGVSTPPSNPKNISTHGLPGKSGPKSDRIRGWRSKWLEEGDDQEITLSEKSAMDFEERKSNKDGWI